MFLTNIRTKACNRPIAVTLATKCKDSLQLFQFKAPRTRLSLIASSTTPQGRNLSVSDASQPSVSRRASCPNSFNSTIGKLLSSDKPLTSLPPTSTQDAALVRQLPTESTPSTERSKVDARGVARTIEIAVVAEPIPTLTIYR